MVGYLPCSFRAVKITEAVSSATMHSTIRCGFPPALLGRSAIEPTSTTCDRIFLYARSGKVLVYVYRLHKPHKSYLHGQFMTACIWTEVTDSCGTMRCFGKGIHSIAAMKAMRKEYCTKGRNKNTQTYDHGTPVRSTRSLFLPYLHTYCKCSARANSTIYCKIDSEYKVINV
jgi:hypothetical protein